MACHERSRRIALGSRKGREQPWNVARIVLSVAIERRDERCAGVTNAGVKRGALPVSFGMSQRTNPRIGLRELLESRKRCVSARVVDEHDLVLDHAAECGVDLLGERS